MQQFKTEMSMKIWLVISSEIMKLRFVSGIPIKHENVLTWATNKLDIDYELFSLLKKKCEETLILFLG